MMTRSRKILHRVAEAIAMLGALGASSACNAIFGIEAGQPYEDDAATATATPDASFPSPVTDGAARVDASLAPSSVEAGGGRPMCVVAPDCASQPHVRPGAPVQCTAGRCVIPATSCAAGYGHCSSSDLEYCETDLTGPSRCGSCTKVCPADAPLCLSGTCAARCPASQPSTCAGSCVDTNSDLLNCGGCGRPCSFPNADAVCVAGACTMAACKPGYGDCTSVPGCETRLDTLANCGACGKACGLPGDTATCDTGACVVGCAKRIEDCFNGVDDDCDGLLDCADPDCSVRAMCAPAGIFTFGTPVDPGLACPPGFTGGSLALHDEFNPGLGCTGCGCTPTTTDCPNMSVVLYDSQAECMARSERLLGRVPVAVGDACIARPIGFMWTGAEFRSPGPVQHCTNTGVSAAARPTPTTTTFCAVGGTAVARNGCSTGQECVPRPPGRACLLTAGNPGCPSGFNEPQVLYESYTDTRVCSCSCEANGGECLLGVNVGDGDMSGTCASIPQLSMNYPYCGVTQHIGFTYAVVGQVSNPTRCDARNNTTGQLTANGPHLLCCAP